MSGSHLDTLEAFRLVLDALDQTIASVMRRSGDVEIQEAERLSRRARLRIDAALGAALREVG